MAFKEPEKAVEMAMTTERQEVSTKRRFDY